MSPCPRAECVNSARSVRRAGSGNGVMDRLLGHRQTERAGNRQAYVLGQPRHFSTLLTTPESIFSARVRAPTDGFAKGFGRQVLVNPLVGAQTRAKKGFSGGMRRRERRLSLHGARAAARAAYLRRPPGKSFFDRGCAYVRRCFKVSGEFASRFVPPLHRYPALFSCRNPSWPFPPPRLRRVTLAR
jgi:hypothetical protein